MEDAEKSRAQLVAELAALRARVAELENAEAKRRRALNQSTWTASHDRATGLFDRAHFLDRLMLAVRSAQRHEYPVSVCMCAFDSIDSVRAEMGAGVSEELLAEFGELIIDELRGEDIAGRYAHNEFCMVFPYTQAADSTVPVERLRARLAKMVNGLAITVSCGIADLSSGGETGRDLLALAEKAMRSAQEAGGNRIVVYKP